MSKRAAIFIGIDNPRLKDYSDYLVETLSTCHTINDLRYRTNLTNDSLRTSVINILDGSYRLSIKTDVCAEICICSNKNNGHTFHNRCYGSKMCPYTILIRAILDLLAMIPDRASITVYCDYIDLRTFIQTEIDIHCKDLGYENLILTIDNIAEYQDCDWNEENVINYLNSANNHSELTNNKHIVVYSSVGYPKISVYASVVIGTVSDGIKHTNSVLANLFYTWLKS